MSSLEAPAMRSAADPIASATFSRTISLASRRARFPPAISFNIRSPMTSLASSASIIQDWSSLCFPGRRNMVAPLVLSFSAGIHLAVRDVAFASWSARRKSGSSSLCPQECVAALGSYSLRESSRLCCRLWATCEELRVSKSNPLCSKEWPPLDAILGQRADVHADH